jgi:ATP-dependent 26S proteasome regulatory subunit
LGFELVLPKYGFESVGGYDALKSYLRELINLQRNPIADDWGLEPTRGILLFGEGGTGKTYITKAFAYEAGLPFIKVDRSDLFGGIVGESEQKVRNLIRIAEEQSPCILFIDEFDQIGQKRDQVMSTDSGVGRGVMTMLMSYLGDESRQAIVVATTNVIEQLDEAIIRAGRFDDRIPMFHPDASARAEILKVHLNIRRKIKTTGVDLSEIVRRTANYSGAELETIVKKAGHIALAQGKKSVTMKHFDLAIKEVSIPQGRVERIKRFNDLAKQFATSTSLLRAQIAEQKSTVTRTAKAAEHKRRTKMQKV